jgi:FKBP-type peptidyl-prolyl cis-trans isomerase FkpA
VKSMRLIAIAFIALVACAEQAQAPPGPETEEERKLYAIGLSVAGNTLGTFKGEFSAEEVAMIAEGFKAGMAEEEPAVDMKEYGPGLNEYLQQRFQNVQARAQEQAVGEKEKGAAFLETAAAEPGAVRTASGLVYIEQVVGTGAQPQPTDKVKVHYHGTLIDGTVFDSSVERNEPVDFPLNQVIAGWTEGVAMMKVGGKAKLVIPSDLAYGDQPQGQIPPGSTLVFEVELLGIE